MKIDLKKQIATYTAPRGRFEVVTVPAMRFLMIDGHGDPNTSSAYQNAGVGNVCIWKSGQRVSPRRSCRWVPIL